MTHPAVIFGGGVAVCTVMGLTGAGGAALTVPYLIYVVGMGAHDAVGVSLAAVSFTAFLGAARAWSRDEVERRAAFAFIAGGVMGGPIGAWLGSQVREDVLLKLFAGLLVVVATRMWTNEAAPLAPRETPVTEVKADRVEHPVPLVLIGIGIGLFQGLFGVGGGFIIVPSLMMIVRTPIERAIGTSLTVITAVSCSTFVAHVQVNGFEHHEITLIFAAGGVLGLALGVRLRDRLPSSILQRIFASLLIVLALTLFTR